MTDTHDINQMREAFEKEAHTRCWANSIGLQKLSCGDYVDSTIQLQWLTWQAAWNTRSTPQAASGEVERVAKAIYDSTHTLVEWNELSKNVKGIYHIQAQAAIAAMQPGGAHD